MKSFVSNKKPEENLFEQINAQKLNDYLHTLMEGLTGKVFRTFNASFTLQNQLDLADFNDKVDTLDSKVVFYDESNKEVAILCNHQKTISKTYEASRDKALERIEDIESYLADLKEHYNLLKKKRSGYESQEATEKGKIARKFPPS